MHAPTICYNIAVAKNGIKKVGIITKHNIKIGENAAYFKNLISALKSYDVDLLFDEVCGELAGKEKHIPNPNFCGVAIW